MNWTSRRRFLAAAAMSVAATRMRSQSAAQVTLTIPAEATGPRVPEDYVGLSYEVQQLLDPTFFSAQNTGLIRELKSLSPNGVLRLGEDIPMVGHLDLVVETGDREEFAIDGL